MIGYFDKRTDWSVQVKSLLLDLIIYTFEYQQILWDNKFYILDKGIPTGCKHCFPLANIFLSYILKELLYTNPESRAIFHTNLKLWKHFIDDCGVFFLAKINLVLSLNCQLLILINLNYILPTKSLKNSSIYLILKFLVNVIPKSTESKHHQTCT